MTGRDREAPPDGEVAGREYYERRVRQLEADNAALVDRADALERRVAQLNGLIGSMSRAAQAFRVTRMALWRPGALVRLPVSLARIVRQRPAVAEPPAPPVAPRAVEDGRTASGARPWADAALRTLERRTMATEPRDPSTLRLALIADDAIDRGLSPECTVVRVAPHEWQRALEEARPDLLLVQSAWRGNAGAWQYRVGWYPHPDSYRLGHLRAVVDWCRAAGIPTVFWSTEDPLQADRFEDAARLFDHVFTVDPGSAERLGNLPGRRAARIGHLPMAAQPRLHHPTDRADDPRTATFIGSYYRGSSVAQRGDLDLLLDAGSRAGLTIYDRQLGSDPDLFSFPERFRDRVGPWLGAPAIPAAIRAHRAVLVRPDPDAVPARVFEALACGRPVVTTSRAAAARTMKDGVLAGASPADLDTILAGIAERSPALDRTVDRAIVDVMRAHTYRHRLATIAREVGYDVTATPAVVALACLADDEAAVDRLVDVVARLGDEISEVVVGSIDGEVLGRGCRERIARLAGATPVRIVHQAADEAATRFQRLAAIAGSPWIHPCDVRGREPARSLAPLLGALAYADADIVGSPEGGDLPYRPAAAVCGTAAIVRRVTLLDVGWPADPGAATAAMAAWAARGIRVYAAAELPEVAGA